MLENLKVERNLYKWMGKFRPLNLGNFTPLLTNSVQRSLQTLMDKGMINRKFRVLGVGGFAYIYTATPLDKTKKIMEQELQVWYNMMSKLVMKFEKS